MKASNHDKTSAALRVHALSRVSQAGNGAPCGPFAIRHEAELKLGTLATMQQRGWCDSFGGLGATFRFVALGGGPRKDRGVSSTHGSTRMPRPPPPLHPKSDVSRLSPRGAR
jgi:hypothetical protein